MTVLTPSATSVITAEFVNPVIVAVRNVFERMLDIPISRTGLSLQTAESALIRPTVSGVIGLSGQAAGTFVFSVSYDTAIEILDRMVGIRVEVVDDQVCDAIGEMVNMIAGHAKAQLGRYGLSISLPNVVSGNDHNIHFPSEVTPMVMTFSSPIGELHVAVGFKTLPKSVPTC